MKRVLSCLVVTLIGTVACQRAGGVASLRAAELCKSGQELEVAWPARLYAARVVSDIEDEGACQIRYDEESRRWSARVSPERIYSEDRGQGRDACREGDRVWVDWVGTQWYPATVLDGPRDEQRCRVRYIGFDEAWDEAVTMERLRAPGA
ncbi:MAG: hypothetical protein AAFZ38_06340 [Myxococcota bacterium]